MHTLVGIAMSFTLLPFASAMAASVSQPVILAPLTIVRLGVPLRMLQESVVGIEIFVGIASPLLWLTIELYQNAYSLLTFTQ